MLLRQVARSHSATRGVARSDRKRSQAVRKLLVGLKKKRPQAMMMAAMRSHDACDHYTYPTSMATTRPHQNWTARDVIAMLLHTKLHTPLGVRNSPPIIWLSSPTLTPQTRNPLLPKSPPGQRLSLVFRPLEKRRSLIINFGDFEPPKATLVWADEAIIHFA